MICRRCHQRLLAQRNVTPSIRTSSRHFSQTPMIQAQAVTAQTTQATNPGPHDKPAASSNSAAQAFSTPPTPTQGVSDLPTPPESGKQPVKVRSSVPAGTVLKGLNFFKNKQDPVALEDHEYPPWLWTVLNQRGDAAASSGLDAEGDIFSKSKKQRRIAAKALRKQQMLDPESLAPKVPLYEQSVDLLKGDGTVVGNREAGEARQELTKALRDHRRSKIKEANFLKEMR